MYPEVPGGGGGHSWSRGRVRSAPGGEVGKAAGVEAPRIASNGNRSQVQHTPSHAVPTPFLSPGTFSLLSTPPYPRPLCLFFRRMFSVPSDVFSTQNSEIKSRSQAGPEVRVSLSSSLFCRIGGGGARRTREAWVFKESCRLTRSAGLGEMRSGRCLTSTPLAYRNMGGLTKYSLRT